MKVIRKQKIKTFFVSLQRWKSSVKINSEEVKQAQLNFTT